MNYSIVYKDDAKYSTFPGITCLPGNRIIIAFREAGYSSVEAASKDAPCHHDNDSVISIIESIDGGTTFPKEQKRIVLSGNNGYNDPALTVLENGVLILRSIAIQVENSVNRTKLKERLLAHRPDMSRVSCILGITIQKSFDGGKNWTPASIITVDGDNQWCSRDAVTELEDGSIILPVYKSVGTEAERAYLIRSFDEGITWSDAALIAEDSKGAKSMFRGVNYNEVSVLNLNHGRLLAMIRSDSSYRSVSDQYMAIGGTGELTQSWSDNAGLSWSPLHLTGIWGQPPNLLKLKNGAILCTYGYRKPPYGIRACISYDNGITWDLQNEIIIKENCPFWDMGYPMSVQREDGTIVTVYYWVSENKTRYIEAAIWEVIQ